jgi:hypothetical protein
MGGAPSADLPHQHPPSECPSEWIGGTQPHAWDPITSGNPLDSRRDSALNPSLTQLLTSESVGRSAVCDDETGERESSQRILLLREEIAWRSDLAQRFLRGEHLVTSAALVLGEEWERRSMALEWAQAAKELEHRDLVTWLATALNAAILERVFAVIHRKADHYAAIEMGNSEAASRAQLVEEQWDGLQSILRSADHSFRGAIQITIAKTRAAESWCRKSIESEENNLRQRSAKWLRRGPTSGDEPFDEASELTNVRLLVTAMAKERLDQDSQRKHKLAKLSETFQSIAEEITREELNGRAAIAQRRAAFLSLQRERDALWDEADWGGRVIDIAERSEYVALTQLHAFELARLCVVLQAYAESGTLEAMESLEFQSISSLLDCSRGVQSRPPPLGSSNGYQTANDVFLPPDQHEFQCHMDERAEFHSAAEARCRRFIAEEEASQFHAMMREADRELFQKFDISRGSFLSFRKSDDGDDDGLHYLVRESPSPTLHRPLYLRHHLTPSQPKERHHYTSSTLYVPRPPPWRVWKTL